MLRFAALSTFVGAALAATGGGASCPSTTGACPAVPPMAAYAASNGILTAAQCCAQCQVPVCQ